ncbi:MAG: enoyl-CoA hydratase/isomerase family protein [Marinirhabdus sp.]
MNFENCTATTQNGTTTITVNRPSKLNALNAATIQELHTAFKMADEGTETRAIILTGSGQKAFVAGADIREFAGYSVSEGTAFAARGQATLFDFVAHLSTPVIAAINGFALGGGLELAMAAHLRIASDNAKMGLPEVSLGVIPGYGGTQRLPQLVGKGRALEMITTANMITAQQALQYGLVNHVTAQEDLIPLAEKLAGKIVKNSPLAIAAAIKAINAGYESSTQGYGTEIAQFGKCFGTADFKEGTQAFLEKRRPDFSNN